VKTHRGCVLVVALSQTTVIFHFFSSHSTAIRAHQQFVFHIPDGITSGDASSMLCAGLTVYSPLRRNDCGPGKKVGIVSVSGLGHYVVLFAKALGAEVYAFTHSTENIEDLEKIGADHNIDVGQPDFEEPYKQTLGLIISTREVAKGFDLSPYLHMLLVNQSFITVGLPDEPLPSLSPFTFAPNGCTLGGSKLDSKVEATEML
jgi:alcohol dehydrogenase (NADP+)